MLFFAARVVRHPAMQNPTLVVLTDRNDLDDQLFGQFQRCADILGQVPVQAGGRDHLRTLLNRASGGVVFTTIHKFMPERGEAMPELSSRQNIVVIADEAHRSQYGFGGKVNEKTGEMSYGFASNLRDALRLPSPRVGHVDVDLDAVAVGVREIQGLGDVVVDRGGRDTRRVEPGPGLAQLIEAVADLECDVVQPDSGLAVAAALPADFHHAEIVMVAKGEERHLEPTLVESGADRQAEHAAVEPLGPLAVRHSQHHVPQRTDLHVGSSTDEREPCSNSRGRASRAWATPPLCTGHANASTC